MFAYKKNFIDTFYTGTLFKRNWNILEASKHFIKTS